MHFLTGGLFLNSLLFRLSSSLVGLTCSTGRSRGRSRFDVTSIPQVVIHGFRDVDTCISRMRKKKFLEVVQFFAIRRGFPQTRSSFNITCDVVEFQHGIIPSKFIFFFGFTFKTLRGWLVHLICEGIIFLLKGKRNFKSKFHSNLLLLSGCKNDLLLLVPQFRPHVFPIGNTRKSHIKATISRCGNMHNIDFTFIMAFYVICAF